jgi:hypothetical protein
MIYSTVSRNTICVYTSNILQGNNLLNTYYEFNVILPILRSKSRHTIVVGMGHVSYLRHLDFEEQSQVSQYVTLIMLQDPWVQCIYSNSSATVDINGRKWLK